MKPNIIYFRDGHTEPLTLLCYVSDRFILFGSNDDLYAFRKNPIDIDLLETIYRFKPYLAFSKSNLFMNEFYKCRFKLSNIDNLDSVLNVEDKRCWEICNIEKFTCSEDLYLESKFSKRKWGINS